MKPVNVKMWITGVAFSVSLISTPTFSATVFEDLFGQPGTVTIQNDSTPGSDWQRRNTINLLPTKVTLGNGELNIKTEDPQYGGASTSLSDTFDFFNQELTFTFSGFNLKPVGVGNPSYQWAKVGVIAGSGGIWSGYSHFIIVFNGSGQFSIQVQQPSLAGNKIEKIAVKDFRVPYFNFKASDLTKVQLVLDDTHFRILFVFANELDQLSFGGTHGLDKNRWYYDTAYLGLAQYALTSAQTALDRAIATGDQAAIDAAQLKKDDAQAKYDAKLLEAAPLKGDSAILVSAASNDANVLRNVDGETEVGASLTLKKVSVETTNTLSVLKTTP